MTGAGGDILVALERSLETVTGRDLSSWPAAVHHRPDPDRTAAQGFLVRCFRNSLGEAALA